MTTPVLFKGYKKGYSITRWYNTNQIYSVGKDRDTGYAVVTMVGFQVNTSASSDIICEMPVEDFVKTYFPDSIDKDNIRNLVRDSK